MRNLEQIRAAAAFVVAPKTSKAAVSKLPAMILANGLLPTAAFGTEKKKDGGTPKRPEMEEALRGAAKHLATPELGISVLAGCSSAEDLIARLTKTDSVHLQRATAEALAFIGYVKRFATKEGSEEGADE